MRKIFINIALVVAVSVVMFSCKKKDAVEKVEVEADNSDYFVDETGKYVVEFRDDGYNVYENEELLPAVTERSKITTMSVPDAANLVKKKVLMEGGFTKTQNVYNGFCILPVANYRTKVEYPSGFTPRQSYAKKVTSIAGGYRVTPRPKFLGGSSSLCYECLIKDGSISRSDFYFAICNGRPAFGGDLLDYATLSSLNSSLGSVNLKGQEVTTVVNNLEASGVYKCTRQ